jgi:membrane protease YdiL (CAAX protease family)
MALGNPQYAGFKGIFLPHLLLYSTLTALIAGLVWFALVRQRLLSATHFATPNSRQLSAGIVGGIIALIVSLLFVYFMFPAGTIHWIEPSFWKIAGNVFSNFYEEFIFRGFMLAALSAAIGFWPAAIVSSAMWGYKHNQYPLSLQLLITGTGIYFSWLMRQTRSLWTPYVSHMVLDVIGDSLIG